MQRFVLWLIPLAAAACIHPSTQPGPVMPDRPGFSDMPNVLPAGAAQLESGFTDDRAAGMKYQTVGEALLRVGVGRGVELRMFGNSYAMRTGGGAAAARGMEDAKIGAKLRIIDLPDTVHGLTPTLALLVSSSLPTGAPGLTAGVAQPEAHVAANWTTSGPFSFAANAGIAKEFDGAAWSNQGSAVASTSFDINEHVSLFAEGMRALTLSGPSQSATYIDGGLTFLLGEQIQLDAHVGRGISRGVSGERSFGFGIAHRF
jgi:hypothetical protein